MNVRRRAFTLIELLVVLAILAVLLGMGAAAIFRVSKEARERVEIAAWRTARGLGETTRRTVTLRVLFVGNSYTSVNDLPGLVQALAEAAGNTPALVVDWQMPGGATLEQHWNDGEAARKIRARSWDLVVLQEQSQRPMFEPKLMHQYARLFDDLIRQCDAIPLFYLTWARQDAPETQRYLTQPYMSIARERKAEVSPVGIAWERALKEKPARVLHMADGSHPNEAGSYLAACVFYAVIFDRSPVGLPATLRAPRGSSVSVPADEAAALQAIAWQTHLDTKRSLLRHRGLAITHH